MRPEDANRERLCQFLRDEDAQRENGFLWDFQTELDEASCGTVGCAIGAADYLSICQWRPDGALHHNARAVCKAIGLPGSAADLFTDPGLYTDDRSWDGVTATMVADKIEQVAAKGWAG